MNFTDESFNLGFGFYDSTVKEQLNNSSCDESIINTYLSPIDQPDRINSFNHFLNLKPADTTEPMLIKSKSLDCFITTQGIRKDNKYSISNNILNLLQSDEDILKKYLVEYRECTTDSISEYLISIIQEKEGSIFMQSLLLKLPKSLISLIYSYVSKPI